MVCPDSTVLLKRCDFCPATWCIERYFDIATNGEYPSFPTRYIFNLKWPIACSSGGMEKMFVYPETVMFALAAQSMIAEPVLSRAEDVSFQSKRYRAILEQCRASSAVATRTRASSLEMKLRGGFKSAGI
jgi:hypothetical protein